MKIQVAVWISKDGKRGMWWNLERVQDGKLYCSKKTYDASERCRLFPMEWGKEYAW